MNFKTIKRKILSLVERMRLSENEYNELKDKSVILDNVMSTFKFEINTENADTKGKYGEVLWRRVKARKATITVDVEQMLKNLGISWNGGDCEVKIINCKEGQRIQMTNYERIKQMSVAEMAMLLSDIQYDNNKTTIPEIEMWLESEVEDDENG